MDEIRKRIEMELRRVEKGEAIEERMIKGSQIEKELRDVQLKGLKEKMVK